MLSIKRYPMITEDVTEKLREAKENRYDTFPQKTTINTTAYAFKHTFNDMLSTVPQNESKKVPKIGRAHV